MIYILVAQKYKDRDALRLELTRDEQHDWPVKLYFTIEQHFNT